MNSRISLSRKRRFVFFQTRFLEKTHVPPPVPWSGRGAVSSSLVPQTLSFVLVPSRDFGSCSVYLAKTQQATAGACPARVEVNISPAPDLNRRTFQGELSLLRCHEPSSLVRITHNRQILVGLKV